MVDHPEIEELDVIISSLRQTLLLDSDNAHANPVDEKGRKQSCTAITEDFLSDVKWKIALLFEKNRIMRPVPKITFHPLLLSDIYYGLHYGTTFKKMQEFQHYTCLPFNKRGFVQAKNLLNKPADLAHYNRKMHKLEKVWNSNTPGFEFADTSKLLMLWVQMQYFAQDVYEPGQPFVFRFVDDNQDIIEAVTQFFQAHPLLVPENCSLESLYMSSNYDHYPPETTPCKIVTGLGAVHDQYRTLCNDIAVHVLDHCDRNDFDAKEAMIRSLLLEHNQRMQHQLARCSA